MFKGALSRILTDFLTAKISIYNFLISDNTQRRRGGGGCYLVLMVGVCRSIPSQIHSRIVLITSLMMKEICDAY